MSYELLKEILSKFDNEHKSNVKKILTNREDDYQ